MKPSVSTRKIVAFVNPGAGTVPTDGVDQLTKAFERLGYDAAVHALEPDCLDACFDRAECGADTLVVVWGGDGTAALCLDRFGPQGITVLPLPGGTMNMLHKEIHGRALQWDECLALALEEGADTALAAGFCGDRRFYVGAMMGRLSHLSEPREALRDGDIMAAWHHLTTRDLLDLSPVLTLRLELADPDTNQQSLLTLTTPACAVFIGRKAGAPVFEVGAVAIDTAIGLAAVIAETAAMGWRDAPHVAFHRAARVDIVQTEGAVLPATFDGEPAELDSEITLIARESGVIVRSAA